MIRILSIVSAFIILFISSVVKAQNVGIGTTIPAAKLHVAEGPVLFTRESSVDALAVPPVTGPGIRMMWFPGKAAFRAGEVTGTNWDRDSIGDYSVAMGYDAKATAVWSVAFGSGIARGIFSTALGQSQARGFSSTSGGRGFANGEFSSAFGHSVLADAYGGFSTGMYNDISDAPSGVMPGSGTDRLFQVGNGTTANRSNAITVLRNGNVGIGVLAPSSLLDISSASISPQISINQAINNEYARLRFLTTSNLSRYWDIGGTVNTGTPASDRLNIYNSSSGNILILTGDGKVGIGNFNPAERLDVAGNIKATGTITPSDKRFKKEIMPLQHSLQKLTMLNGVSYNWRNDEFPGRGFDSTLQDGFIAQEVEKVFPEIVKTSLDGYKGVDYTKLIPSLVEAIKEQQKMIDALKEEIKELKTLEAK